MRRNSLHHFERRDQDDQKQNESGRLPEDERVEIPVIWIAELFTPSTVSGLSNGISKLGWESDRTGDNRLSKWMNDVRAGRQRGWISLGLVTPENSTIPFPTRIASLPEGIEAALPSLMSVTPSITALVMAFIGTEENARSINAPLKAYYSTQKEINSRFRRKQALSFILGKSRFLSGESIIWPDIARRREVVAFLDMLEQNCAAWVRNNLPGVFASGLRNECFPAAMLMVTEKTLPLSEDARSIRAFEGLNLNRDFVAWKSESWPLTRLAFPDSTEDECLRLIFACRRSDGPKEMIGVPEPTSNWSIAQQANDLEQGILSKWALICMLDGFHHFLSVLRDKAATKNSHFPVHELKTLRNMLKSHLFDIDIAAQEINEFLDSELYSFESIHFEEVRDVEDPSDLLQNFKSYQKRTSRLIERESNLLQSTLKISTEMTQNLSNIRLQRFLVFLTLISILIAIIAIVIAVSHAS